MTQEDVGTGRRSAPLAETPAEILGADHPDARKRTRSVTLGVLCLLLSATSFGAMAIFAHIAYGHGADVHGVLLVRFTVAAVILVGCMAVTSTRRPAGRDLLLLIVMGAIGYVGQSLTYFTALTLIPAGLVAVLFYSYPALVVICTAIASRRLPARSTAAGVTLAVLGVVLVAGAKLSANVTGITLGIAAAVIYTCYILVGGRLSSAVSPLASATTVCMSAAVVYGAGCLFHQPSLPSDAAGWLASVATAVISTVVAIVAFFIGLRLLGPAPSAAISTVEPVVTGALAFLVLGQRLSWVQLVGGGAICASVLIIAVARARPVTPPANPDQLPPPSSRPEGTES